MSHPSTPPDRLAVVLGEVDKARQSSAWLPSDPADRSTGRAPRERGSSARDRRSDSRGASGPDPDGAAAASAPLRRGDRRRGVQREDADRELRPRTPLLPPRRTLGDTVVAPGRVAVAAVLILLACAALVLGGRWWWLSRTGPEVPQQPAAGAVLDPSADRSAGAGAGSGTGIAATPSVATTPQATARADAAPTRVLVHVVGQVNRPGVVELTAGARVRDAVSAAGGARQGADLARLNLARPVSDGEQVRVPAPGEEVTEPPQQTQPAAADPSADGSGGAGSSGATGSVVNLNTADAAELDALPGVGPVIAQRIVQWRTENGRFSSIDDLNEVSGIGEKAMARLRPLVTV
ncbi:helix-hairpin-helix domain-containing protein [Dermacoccaceae bacterium W4C1]